MRFLSLTLLASAVAGFVVNQGSTCTLYPESLTHGGLPVDDVPSIHEAFNICGINGTVIFSNGTFNIATVLNTTNLLNVDVILRGVLQFTDNIPYWRSHSWSVIFQNQVTSWLFGGTNVTLRGDGGWIDGHGQSWYTFSANTANLPGRPITITVYNSTNVLIDSLSIIQPQFWAFFVWKSQNVSLTNYYTNATSNNAKFSTFNTDGFDSWNSDTILIENATIITNDDCVAAKGNTTNLYAKNITCYGSTGMTIGSIGQYPATPDYVFNVTFEDVRCIGGLDCAYVKTWQSAALDVTTNGDAGGGGGGLVKNVTFRNFEVQDVGLPIQVTQCIYATASGQGCNTSNLALEDISWVNFTGTSKYNIAASMYCASNHPCPGIMFSDVNINSVNATEGLALYNTTLQTEVYQCDNIIGQNTSGIPCNHVAPAFFSQAVTKNVQ
ncbi:hypothetical protein BP5796_04264 [Coleophoma crateriformis]|uniref:galacturonan 1,4-alpha-galacturonidase n=1 Tax=Coleophoma crateriformis TaxID=565419 RepID=A0A3D8SHX2_9HELO|nr:hypothetical protein BP5796_04264 [Coleophoma crateriformis]